MDNSQKYENKLYILNNIVKKKLLNLFSINKLEQSKVIFDKSNELVNNINNINYLCLIYNVINKIISYYKNNNFMDPQNLNNCNLDLLLSRTIYILNSQAKFNPPQYISHGVDHSLRTMQYCIDLFTKSKIINESLTNKYNLTEAQNELLLIYLGLFHDIGYSDIEVVYKNDNDNTESSIMIPKFIHSYSSYKMLKDENYNKLFINTITEPSFEDMILAIKHHNYDSEKCNNNKNDKSCLFLSDKNKFTTYIEAGVRINREYIEASIEQDPLLFIIRFADNLDFIRHRLSNIQNDISLIKLFKDIFKVHCKEKPDSKNSITTLFNKYLEEKKISFNNQVKHNEKYKMINSVYENENKDDFLHYYGNWIVDKIDISIHDHNFLFKIFFYDIDDNDYDELLFVKNIYPALYQLNRLFDSYNSLLINNRKLLEYISVELIFIHEGKRYNKKFTAIKLIKILNKLKEKYIETADDTSINDLMV